jgi:hypothetical protein
MGAICQLFSWTPGTARKKLPSNITHLATMETVGIGLEPSRRTDYIKQEKECRKGGIKMRRPALILIGAIALVTLSCATQRYNTQKSAAVGAGLGAIADQVIGRNTAGTLIGLAGGALAGAIVGNAVDQDEMNRRLEGTRHRRAYATPEAEAEAPPGQWVQVPGRWVDGKWVPSHKVWVPVNP